MLPQRILDKFARIAPDTTVENKYYGAYDKTLNGLFDTLNVNGNDSAEEYIVEPQYTPTCEERGIPAINFVITHLFLHTRSGSGKKTEGDAADKPIFFLEIKPPVNVNSGSARIAADAQMRARFRSLRDDCPIPILHGISVMGQRLAFYSMDKATGCIEPRYIAMSKDYVTNPISADRWQMDVTTEEGYQRFLAVVNDVKDMVKMGTMM